MKIITEIVKAKDVIKHELSDGIDGYFDYQTYQLRSNKNVNFDDLRGKRRGTPVAST